MVTVVYSSGHIFFLLFFQPSTLKRNKIIHFSPLIHNYMNSINRKPKHISIWIIIYSGASVTILAGDLTKPFSMYSTKNTEWKTQEGSFNTNTTIKFFLLS